jgi:cytoskeletal protein CcmA (bactofilin family)
MGTIKKIDAITTFLGHDAIIDGTIEFKGVIRVDGEITGKVQSDDGTIIVGEKAVVNGDITVGNAIITGEVNGNIDAKSRVEIYSPGRVMGDIQAAVISIDPGSFFNGKCMMTSRMTPQKKSEFFHDKSIAVDDSEGKEKKSKKL